MRDLEQLQQAFQNYLLARALPIKEEVVSGNLPVELRLDIYHSAYYMRLKEVLDSDYPILAGLLGEKKFAELARAYINHYPSRFRSIRFFGEKLATFLLMQDSSFAEKPWLSEVAKLEWALTNAFDAPNETAVTIDDIAKVPPKKWPYLCFKLHGTCELLTMEWNSGQLLNAWKVEKKRKKPRKTNEVWLVWRKDYEVQFTQLSQDELFVISAFKSGQNFSEVCEGLCQWVEESQVGLHAATILKRFILEGVFSKLSANKK